MTGPSGTPLVAKSAMMNNCGRNLRRNDVEGITDSTRRLLHEEQRTICRINCLCELEENCIHRFVCNHYVFQKEWQFEEGGLLMPPLWYSI